MKHIFLEVTRVRVRRYLRGSSVCLKSVAVRMRERDAHSRGLVPREQVEGARGFLSSLSLSHDGASGHVRSGLTSLLTYLPNVEKFRSALRRAYSGRVSLFVVVDEREDETR